MGCTNDQKEEEGMLRVVYGDVTLGVYGRKEEKEFHYIFSYTAGGLESLNVEGKEWLYRVPRPTFWRATTDNDKGNLFPQKSGMWLGADMFIHYLGVRMKVDEQEVDFPIAPRNNQYSGKEKAASIEIIYRYETNTYPMTEVLISYRVSGDGSIRVELQYEGRVGLPELPVLGLRMIMPTCADKFVYEGLSGETYPDRKAGGIKGVYEVQGLPVTPYMVPQDCGMHMDTKWVQVYRTTELDNRRKEAVQTALKFKLDGLAFSCLPYTASELENATHMEELPPKRRTVLCVYGAVRGVGGIDSWGADVEERYHVKGDRNHTFSFSICLP